MAKPRLNEVRIIGNLGRDPELRYTTGGFAIAEFSVAIDNSYYNTKQNEWVNKTAWRKVTATGDLAEWVGRNLQKGDCVFINGKEDMDQWEDRQTREKRTKEFIKAIQVFLIDAGIDPKEDAKPNRDRDPRQSGGPGRGRRQESSQDHPPYPDDDDIPF